MLFETGQRVATPNVLDFIRKNELDAAAILRRHMTGDWDEMDTDDAQMNRDAVKNGDDRIFSVFKYNNGKIYVITEWDRSVTTILMAEDY